MKKMGLSVFENAQFGRLETYDDDGEILFGGYDVAKKLEYIKPYNAVQRFVPPQHRRLVRIDASTVLPRNGDKFINGRGNPNKILIDEAGMYRLIFKSHMPGADDFVEWITADVLPTLRKTGFYSTGAKLIAPEVHALIAGKSPEEVQTALKQYENRIAGIAKQKATNAAKRAAATLADGDIMVAIGRAMGAKLCGGRFGEGMLQMYDVIDGWCHIPLRDRKKIWQMGRSVGTPSADQRPLYTFILPEEIPGVLQNLTKYCAEQGLDIRDIVSKRQPRLTA